MEENQEIQKTPEKPKEPDKPKPDGPVNLLRKGDKPEKQTITVRKDQFFYLLMVVLLVVGFGIGYVVGGGFNTATPEGAPTGGGTAEPVIEKISISADDDPMKGSRDAPITIIEFSDFQCPFCSRFAQQILPDIKKNYIETNKTKFVFRDMPLGFHDLAESAAIATECADEQGKYWEFHDKLYANQTELNASNIIAWAQELNLNTTQFNECYNSTKYKAEVQKDASDATAAGVAGTPTFFVIAAKTEKNELPTKAVVEALKASVPEQYKDSYAFYYSSDDKNIIAMLVGAQPYEMFKQVIDAELTE